MTPGPRKIADATLLGGDCFEVLATLEPESADAIVTDPPYAIGQLVGERWDEAGMVRAARAKGRRLDPGEAFEAWCREWGEGCLRVLKPGGHLLAFSAPRTAHRLACGVEDSGFEIRDALMWLYGTGMPKSHRIPGGLSTTLKPAYEPIVLARRPLKGTTKETLAAFGTGALNTDACKVNGRHPANVLFSHEPACREGRCASGCAAALIDTQANRRRGSGTSVAPSRIFYCPKVSRAERDAGCDHLPQHVLDHFPSAGGGKAGKTARNPHPTVKPLALMRWLVRLACPPGGLVLDPTCGSGSTGAAALLEGRRFLGIELDPTYMEVAAARIAHWAPEDPPKPRARRGPLGKRRRR
ncbi:MAG: DNA-methyltransferase [Solirubrobacterales bacterium]